MHHQASRGRTPRNHYQYNESPAQRRSRSSQPYHAVSETYSKEVTHKPLGPISNFPPEVVEQLRRSASPPLVRSRENTWTDENFPIVRVPSAQFTDILTELYDYQEVEKYTRRSSSPEVAVLKKQNQEKDLGNLGKELSKTPTYTVIPPTPEKNTPRPLYQQHSGIPLTASESLEDIVRRSQKKPLPMYEEYLKNREKSENPEEKFQNLRHIDSSSSECSEKVPRGNPKSRHVYTHNVYVDSTTGRPYTPGRADLDEENCGKLKINVYFKPPHPPVAPTYTLDEIEIEKTSENPHIRLRPSQSASSIKSRPISHFSSGTEKSTTIPRGFTSRTSILRKEHEILEVPLKKRPSSSAREIEIPIQPCEIDLDEIFPKMPTHQGDQPRRESVLTTVDQRIQKTYSNQQHQTQIAEVDQKSTKSATPTLPYTRGISKTPSDQEKRTQHHQYPPSERAPSVYDRNSKTSSNLPIVITQVDRHSEKERFERSGSFISTVTSHKSEKPNGEIIIPVHIVENPEEKTILPLYENRKPKRQSPEELDYGKTEKPKKHFPAGHPRENPTPELAFQRGISRTPNGHEVHYRPERNSKTSHNAPIYAHQPGNVDKERYPKSTPSERSSYRTQKPPSVYSNPQQQTQIAEVDQKSTKSATPVLPYTRGISKTPSDQEKRTHHHQHPPSEGAPSVYERTTSPRSLPRSRDPSVRGRQPRPGHTQNPYEEVVHIKERYERDETIRRFFPTTTTV